MKVQKFRGKTSLEALAKVKEHLGEEAVILSTRRVKEGKKYVYEITAAIDLDPPEPEPRPRESEGFSVLLRELEELKGLIQELKFQAQGSDFWGIRLLEQGVPKEILGLFGGNGKLKKETFLERLSSLVKGKVGPLKFPRVQIFVGQAGVGKTTSLVKLASRFTYEGKEVAIVSLDSVRVGAREQISRFAQFLELPLNFSRLEELPQILSKYQKEDYVLVDTPALSPSFSVSRLAETVNRMSEVGLHLVIRASEAPVNLFALWERVKHLPICSLILTHTESVFNGACLFWMLSPTIPGVSFLSTGDRVPEDFERATPRRLLGLLLRNFDWEGDNV